MSWLVSLILAGSIFATGSNLPTVERSIYEDQGVPAFSRQYETERFQQIYSFNPNGKIEINNLNGSITIEAWDAPQIQLEYVKTAESKERLSEVTVEIQAKQDTFRIETNYDSWKRNTEDGDRDKYRNRNYGMLQVEYKLKVPRTAVLDAIETVNGSVSVSDMTNYTSVSTVNGRVNGTNLRGTAKLETVNGTVNADFDRIEKGSLIALSTVNGSVNLMIPSDANATLKADTLNGSISNDFGLPVKKGEYVGRDLYGKIGNGDVKIKLSSVNGGLSIKRKNDGKNANPATNLLPQKTSNDFDEFDNDFEADLNETQKDLNKARREMNVAVVEKALEQSKVEIARTVRDLEVRIENMNPEISEFDLKDFEEAAIEIDTEKIKDQMKDAHLRKEAVLAGMREFQMPVVEVEKGSFPVKGIPKVAIEAINCSVSLRGWENAEVKYSMTQISKNQSQEPVEITAEKNKADNVIEIKVENNNEQQDKYTNAEPTQVRLEVFVPKKSNLRIVTNSELRVEGVSGEIDLEGEDEMINLRDIDGKLHLTARDGTTRLIGFRGELDTEIADGEMFLEGDFKKIHARAGDGTITLTLPDNANAVIETNGKIGISDDFGGVDVKNSTEKSKIVKECDNIYRFGEGRSKYNFEFGDGKLIVRPQSSISVG